MSQRILIAPLHWGLGHATRCIPIINALIAHGFEPVIASDGRALLLLKKEFPKLEFVELPSYHIEYSKKGHHLKLKLLKVAPKFLSAVKREHDRVQKIIAKFKIDGIISDNRFGVYSKKVPSVYITHQLNVLSGNTTWLSTKLHQKTIKHFDECWVPDCKEKNNLSGELGHLKNLKLPVRYIGPLSRFKKMSLPKSYDVMVLLSGPEPQRSLLEEKLFSELKNYKGNVLFVRGLLEASQNITTQDHLTIYNYMTSTELETAINKSDLIVSRSGYTTIMDLAKLEKKAFFIPTPGQFEQRYLAEKLKKEHIVPFCDQDDFTIERLHDVINYKGFASVKNKTDFKALFSLFERE